MNKKRIALLAIGWGMVVGIVVLSLINISGHMPDIKHSDKLGHLLAYFSISYWFLHLYPRKTTQVFYALGFVIMGSLMEYLQSMTSYRSMDYYDFLMNTAGVIVALITFQIINFKRWFFTPQNHQ
ncbi:MAG: VanZ family protein [Proteobacteria bacterium]|nr:VanZ family protein [Pseudomonadota bacterium]